MAFLVNFSRGASKVVVWVSLMGKCVSGTSPQKKRPRCERPMLSKAVQIVDAVRRRAASDTDVNHCDFALSWLIRYGDVRVLRRVRREDVSCDRQGRWMRGCFGAGLGGCVVAGTIDGIRHLRGGTLGGGCDFRIFRGLGMRRGFVHLEIADWIRLQIGGRARPDAKLRCSTLEIGHTVTVLSHSLRNDFFQCLHDSRRGVRDGRSLGLRGGCCARRFCL